MRSIKDHLGRSIEYTFPLNSIVSLVPSQTELLFDLGLGHKISGRTKFCIHPQEKTQSVKKVGGTKNIRIGDIYTINPDIIIANKEENTQEEIELLSSVFPVWVSDVKTYADSLKLIEDLGSLFGVNQAAGKIIQEIELEKEAFQKCGFDNKTALYLIWKDPFMAAGNDTFIHSMLSLSGFQNVINEPRYPIVEIENISDINPDVILLSSEPFPFKEKHIKELRAQLSDIPIMLVNGEYFSWYGTRMISAFKYFAQLRKKLL